MQASGTRPSSPLQGPLSAGHCRSFGWARTLPPHSVVGLCLSTLNHVRAGRAALAASIARGTPCIKHTLADGSTIDVRQVCTTLQHSLGDATTRDIAAIERSNMPDIHKADKRRKLRLRLEPYRPRRKRLTLQALYDATGAPVVDERP